MADEFDLDGFMKSTTDTTPDEDDSSDDSWVADDAILGLIEDRAIDPTKTNNTRTKQILDSSSPAAAQSLVRLALHGKSESVRLRASQYIVDRALENGATSRSPIEEMFDGVDSDLKAAAAELEGRDDIMGTPTDGEQGETDA